jgi:hypothetical protein
MSVKNALTSFSSAVCLVGILGVASCEGVVKDISYALMLMSGTSAIGVQIGSKSAENELKYMHNKAVEKHERELKLLKDTSDNLAIKLDRKMKELGELERVSNDKTKYLEQKDILIAGLKLTQTQIIEKQALELKEYDRIYTAKNAELDEKLAAENQQIAYLFYLLKLKFQETLKNFVDQNFEYLANAVHHRLNKLESPIVIEALQAFKTLLSEQHQDFRNLLGMIAEIDTLDVGIVDELNEIYFDIHDGIYKLKVRYRNALGKEDKLCLAQALEELEDPDFSQSLKK